MGFVSKLFKNTGKRRFIVATALSVFSAILVWFLARSGGLLERVPEVTIPGLEVPVGPAYVVTVPAAIVLLVVALVVLEAVDEITDFFEDRKEREKRTKQFRSLPKAAQAILVGLPFAVVAVIAILLTNFLTAIDLPDPLLLVVAAAVWLSTSFFTYLHLETVEVLARWLKQAIAGGVVAAVLALAVAAVDIFLFASSLPGYVPLVIFLLGGPVVTALIVRQVRREEDGMLSELLVKSGFAQLQQLQTPTVALALGFLAAVLVGVLASFAGAGLTLTAAVFLVVWLVVAVLAFQWFSRSGEARSDLVIADVYERSSGGRRELSVRNESDEVVDLRSAKIRDTEHDLYRTNIEVVLGAGQTGKFDIPPGFSLYPREDDIARDLPLGFSISQHADAPVIVTRNGQKYRLRWAEGTSPDDSGPGGRGTGSRTSKDLDDRTGVGPEN